MDYLRKNSGSGSGNVSIQVVNEQQLRSEEYEISFSGSPATAFSIKRLDAAGTMLFWNRPVNAADLPVVDGFRVRVDNDYFVGGVKSITDQSGRNVLGSNNLSADSSWYSTFTANASADTAAKASSYEIRFTSRGSIAYTWGIAGSVAKHTIPFEVWNVTTGTQICSEIRDLNNNDTWDKGELIYIINKSYPAPSPAIGSPNPGTSLSSFAYQIGIINAPGDTSKSAPKTGTIVNVTCYNALLSNDSYRFKFKMPSVDNSLVDLSKVRVVPNPYVVTSQYEYMQNVREVRFMFLPSECTIYVYTVSGELVRTLRHKSTTGSLSWNLLTDSNQGLAFGVYVYVVEDPNGNKQTGKFALIK
jgi:hypothetical protein